MNPRYLFCIILFICLSQTGYSQIIPWRNLLNRQQTQQQIPTIEVNPSRISYGNVRLSDIIESIEYIPLETTDESLVGGVGFSPRSFDISDNYIVVSCRMQTQVFLFSRDGRFIRRIGRQGQGPGEYTGVFGVFIDEGRNRIFVMGSHYQEGALIYNLTTGEFVENIPRERGQGSPDRLHNDHFLTSNDVSIVFPFVYQISNLDFQLVAENIQSHFYRFTTMRSLVIMGRPTNYLFNDKIHVRKMALNDTLFAIESDFSFTPRFVVSAGRLSPTMNSITAHPPSQERRQRYVKIGSIYQTTNKLLFQYDFQGRTRFTYFDKNTERLFHFRSESGIPNDFDGGVDFWPRRQDNLIWYQFFDAYYLIENSGGITPTGGAAAVQSFNRLIERLDPDDNPVLMIVRLKE